MLLPTGKLKHRLARLTKATPRITVVTTMIIRADLHERKVFSQSGEDGVIEAILEVIGQGARTFVEIGVGDGEECNCIRLRREKGWSGVLIDRAFQNCDVIQRVITAENVQTVLRECGACESPDVLSIDIDGIDWYVIRNLGMYAPRLLVCEYNPHFDHDQVACIPYDQEFRYAETRFFGASQKATHMLGKELGYSLVYSNYCNLFLVLNQYAKWFELADSCEALYRPKCPDDWHGPDSREMLNPFEQNVSIATAGLGPVFQDSEDKQPIQDRL